MLKVWLKLWRGRTLRRSWTRLPAGSRAPNSLKESRPELTSPPQLAPTRQTSPSATVASAPRHSPEIHECIACAARKATRDGLRHRRRLNKRALPRGTPPALLLSTIAARTLLTQLCLGQQPARQLYRAELQPRNGQLVAAGDAR
jgi:hypothetical protein